MDQKTKKRVLIVEDNQNDWWYFNNWLAGIYDVLPGDEDAFSLFRENIANLYGQNTLAAVSDTARVAIQEQLLQFDADLYIVDYQLIIDNNLGNGIRFSNEFLKEKNILLVTGTEGKKGRDVINKMKKFCEENVAPLKRDFLCKLEFDEDTFMDDFIARVKKFFANDENYNTEGY